MSGAPPLVVGVDASTTACKALAWDACGAAVARGYSPLTIATPSPGWHEQSCELWWSSMLDALRQVTGQVDARRIQALCIAHQRESFVALDGNDQPLLNGILWMDERAADLLPALEQAIGQDVYHRLTGKRMSVNLTVAKLAWLTQHQPGLFDHAAKFLDVHSFLVYRLTGEFRTGWGCADPTGLFDIQQHAWSAPILELVGLRAEQLPELAPPGAVIGSLLPAVAEQCGLPAGLPVAAGIGDGQGSGLGVNITQPGEAYLSLGTSVISGSYSAQPVFDATFRTMTGGIPNTYLLETALLGGGYTVNWFMEKFAGQSRQEYEQAASLLPPGSAGLLLVPYWNSVLGPYWDAAASGIVVGWRGHHTPAHLYRAILEGIAFEQHLCTLGVQQATGRAVPRYIVMGGGAQSPLWRQIIADVTGKTVVQAATREATALGAGMLAAAAAGWYASVREAAQAMSQVLPESTQPVPNRHAFYQRLFDEVYRPLFPALQPYLARLAGLQATEESRKL